MIENFWDNFFQSWTMPLVGGVLIALGGFLIALVALWTIFWKGMALWKSARLGHKYWFVALLVINTLGVLEILYIYFWSKKAKPANKENSGL